MIVDFKQPQEMEIYRSLVRHLVQEGSSRLIENDSVCHARVIIAELIFSAKVSIDIFCNRLAPEVWADPTIVEAVKKAILSGVSIRLITSHAPVDSSLLRLLEQSKVTRVIFPEGESLPNFIVVDSKAYRVEVDEERKQGVACANGGDEARRLAEVFLKMLEKPSMSNSEGRNCAS